MMGGKLEDLLVVAAIFAVSCIGLAFLAIAFMAVTK